MTILLKVDDNTRTVETNITKLKERLSKDLTGSGFEYAKLAQRNLRLQLTRNRTRWRGLTWRSIRAVRETRNRSVVKIRREGIWLDSARPHFVKLKHGRLIRQWALQKGNDTIREIAKREGSIYVKPHPFIDKALTRTRIRFRKILQSKLKRER